MQTFMTFMKDNWGWIVSFVTILGGILVYVYRHIRALQRGVQALLRAQMVDNYQHYHGKGYAPLYARESFENLWRNYEALGANGVFSDIHNKFMALPTHEEPSTHNDLRE